jgi:hypothetical protein
MVGRYTEVDVDGVHVAVVPGALLRVAAPVALGEQRCGDVGNESESDHAGRSGHPSQLRHRPGQRQHAGADHRCDDVRRARPRGPCARRDRAVDTETLEINRRRPCEHGTERGGENAGGRVTGPARVAAIVAPAHLQGVVHRHCTHAALSLSLSLAGWLAIAGTEVRARRGCSRCWLLSRNLEARATTIAEQCGWSYV